jgi:hypothetical protein
MLVIGLFTGFGLLGYAVWEMKSGKAVYRTGNPYVYKSEQPSLFRSAVFLHLFGALAFLALAVLSQRTPHSGHVQPPAGRPGGTVGQSVGPITTNH